MAVTTPPVYVAIPTPTDEPESIVQSILTIKQNIELGHGIQPGRPVTAPTLVNTQLAAAIDFVTP